MVSKAKEKRWVLRRDLIASTEEACLICKGNSFHNFGATTAKLVPF